MTLDRPKDLVGTPRAFGPLVDAKYSQTTCLTLGAA